LVVQRFRFVVTYRSFESFFFVEKLSSFKWHVEHLFYTIIYSFKPFWRCQPKSVFCSFFFLRKKNKKSGKIHKFMRIIQMFWNCFKLLREFRKYSQRSWKKKGLGVWNIWAAYSKVPACVKGCLELPLKPWPSPLWSLVREWVLVFPTGTRFFFFFLKNKIPR